jgi:hypothetical protein
MPNFRIAGSAQVVAAMIVFQEATRSVSVYPIVKLLTVNLSLGFVRPGAKYKKGGIMNKLLHILTVLTIIACSVRAEAVPTSQVDVNANSCEPGSFCSVQQTGPHIDI